MWLHRYFHPSTRNAHTFSFFPSFTASVALPLADERGDEAVVEVAGLEGAAAHAVVAIGAGEVAARGVYGRAVAVHGEVAHDALEEDLGALLGAGAVGEAVEPARGLESTRRRG